MTVAANVRSLKIENVFANPDQPREVFNHNEIGDLAGSIESRGLLEPIIVVKRDGGFMIVAGERRYRAHILLGRTTVEAIIKTMTDTEVSLAAIVENLQRVNLTPLEQARAYKAALAGGMDVKTLAKELGLKQPWRITESLTLLDLNETCLAKFEAGLITSNQAWYLSKLKTEKQDTLLAKITAGVCDTATKLKTAYDNVCRSGGETYSAGLIELGIEFDTKTQAEVNTLQRQLEEISARLADIANSDQWASVEGKIPKSQANVMSIIARNAVKTATQIQRVLEVQSV